MSVYRHKNSPYWQFDFERGGYRFYGSTWIRKNRPKREAEAAEKEQIQSAERLIEDIRASGRKPMTLATATAKWWQEVGQHLREHDLEKHLDWLRDHIGQDKPLHAIANADVLAAVSERRTHHRRAGRDQDGKQLYRPISPRTVNRTVPLLLRRVMRRARDLWDVVILREPKWRELVLKVPKRQTPELSLAGEAAIDAAERGDYRPVRRFATITGLRLTECLLTWPQVDFANAIVRIRQKGGAWRDVPLSREAYAILWAERGRHDMAVFTFVARKTKHDPKSGRAYVRGARYAITAAGIASNRKRHWPVKIRFHDLRHTAGRRTLRATGNLKIVQTQLGHSSITTTADFYADVLVEDVRAAMEATAADVAARRETQAERKNVDRS